MSDEPERIRSEIEQLLLGLRQDLVRGSVTLYRKHFADDATVLAIDNPTLFRGKEACLEYLRNLGQVAKIHSLDADIEDLKLMGDVAVVIEWHTIRYAVGEQTYRDSGRTTWVLHRVSDRWMVTHSHWESLAPNRIVDRAP